MLTREEAEKVGREWANRAVTVKRLEGGWLVITNAQDTSDETRLGVMLAAVDDETGKLFELGSVLPNFVQQEFDAAKTRSGQR